MFFCILFFQEKYHSATTARCWCNVNKFFFSRHAYVWFKSIKTTHLRQQNYISTTEIIFSSQSIKSFPQRLNSFNKKHFLLKQIHSLKYLLLKINSSQNTFSSTFQRFNQTTNDSLIDKHIKITHIWHKFKEKQNMSALNWQEINRKRTDNESENK